jgi:hypothetical protein
MGRRIRKLKPRHFGLMRVIIANPHLTLAECGALVGYSACQVSRIVNSAPFLEQFIRLHTNALDAALRSSLGFGREGGREPHIGPVSRP